MLGLAALPFLAVGLLFTVFDSGSDDDGYEETPDEPETPVTPEEPATPVEPEEPETPVEPEEPEEPVEPETPEAEVINGTAGSDVINAEDNQIVNGLDGDDGLSTSDASNGAVVNSGAGDDSINLAGINVTGNGGEGNDLISASFANGAALNGEAGDDTLNGWRNSSGLVIDGGLGNDTITDEALLEMREDGVMADILTGGEGADSFFINLVNQTILDGQEPLLEGDIGIVSQITDFDPDEDMLLIDVNNADEAGTNDPVRTLDSFTLVEAADGSYTDVQLVISTAGGTGTLTATIRLDGATGLTNDDIAFADRAVA